MSQSLRPSVWPLVGIIVGLFGLSLFAPKAWESLRVRPLEPMRGTRVVAAAPVEPQHPHPAKRVPAVEVSAVRELKSTPSTSAPREEDPPAPAFDAESNAASPPPPALANEPPASLQMPGESSLVARHGKWTPSGSPPTGASAAGDEDPPEPVVWPRPQSLIVQLNELTQEPATSDWARRALEGIEALAALESHDDSQAPVLFDRLRKLSAEATRRAPELKPSTLRIQLKRAEYALARRVEVWEQVYTVAGSGKSTHYPTVVDSRRLSSSLKTIEDSMRGRTGAAAWRNYLQLDKARKLTQTGGLTEIERRDMARSILGRLESPSLNETQAAFFKKPEFAALASELRLWAYEPVEVTHLLEELERYEQQRRREPAQLVAEAFQSLRWSSDAGLAQLADRVETHYRNANLRIAVSGHLINRLLPKIQRTAEAVSENISGAEVQGRSETETRLMIRLIPDRLRIRLGLEAHGVVSSETAASKGPATFYSDGISRYSARKLLTIDRRGMKVWRSEADAESETYNRGFETEWDGLPIFNLLVRSIAQQKQQEQMGAAKREVDARVASKASERLDREVHKKLQEAEQQFQTRVLDPLTKLKLQPTALSMETTAERLIVRYRIAGEHQLAAHTPRPEAPADSWLSLQVHQTAVNNAIEQMHFDGRQMNVRELLVELAKTLGQPAPKLPDDLPDDVTLKFAERDSVRVQCEAGKVLLVVRLAELNAGKGNRWKNFEVRAPLVPQTAGLDAQLIRDGSIELSGERLGLRDQVKLRGIFSLVISKNKAVSLVPEKLRADPRLKDLVVRQFVINDGWISVALAPPRVAKQANSPPLAKGGKAKSK